MQHAFHSIPARMHAPKQYSKSPSSRVPAHVSLILWLHRQNIKVDYFPIITLDAYYTYDVVYTYYTHDIAYTGVVVRCLTFKVYAILMQLFCVAGLKLGRDAMFFIQPNCPQFKCFLAGNSQRATTPV